MVTLLPRRLTSGTATRVMFAIGSLGTGGSEKQLTELLVRLPRDRFDPVLLTVDESVAYPGHIQALRDAGIPVLALGSRSGDTSARRWVRRGRRYVEALQAIDPGLVYAWLDETAAFLAPICRVRGIPCLVARRNVIGSMTERRHRGTARCIHWSEARATLVTANSSAVAAECVARGHRPDRVRIVPNGQVQLPALPSPPSPPVVFGYVAQFRPEKGHHRLIDGLARMPIGPWRVDLAGDGELRPAIEARVAALQLEDRVRFVGEIADIAAFWRERHAAVLLSDSEGSPNALIEAAFAGRPAVATNTGGTPDVVGTGGILVGLEDPAAIVAALTELIADPDGLRRRGRASWEHATQAFSMDGMVQGHVAALEETAVARSARRPGGRVISHR
jgi:glycosyltransferase involved in cell wall biosynthesis